MSKTVLLVDDDVNVGETLTLWFQREGMEAHCLTRGDQVLDWLAQNPVDLVILDVMLPGLDGVSCCLELHQRYPEIPILMLSARDDLMDRVIGLESGADDYVTKPFHPKEVISRVRAIFRRQRHRSQAPEAGDAPLNRGVLSLDRKRYRATLEGRTLDLTTTEFCLLKVLAERVGEVFTRNQLLDSVWGEEFIGSERTVDSHIRNLRSKLKQPLPHYDPIRSVRGIGYSFDG